VWDGTGRDVHKPRLSNPELGGPYDVMLTVISPQDGSRFVARFLAVGVSGEFYTSEVYPSVAGHITDDGEITMFGGWGGTENNPDSILITIKAKLYEKPIKSIRGSWEAIILGGNYGGRMTNSGNFVVYPREYNSDN
jgi:hypothetical protein